MVVELIGEAYRSVFEGNNGKDDIEGSNSEENKLI